MSHLRQETLNVAGAIIGTSLVGILAFLAWALVYVRVPDGNETAMNVLLGILSTQVGMVVGFYFGSSFSSKKQTETIDTLAKTAQVAGEALSPSADATVTLEPGQSAKVSAEQVP